MRSMKAEQFFENMKNACVEYDRSRQARLQEKDVLILKSDWDGVKMWNEREERFPFPLNRGESTAYRAWVDSVRNDSSIFEVADLPWNEDVVDFVETLRKAGITEIAVTDHSTALMDGLHALDAEGFHIVSTCVVRRIVGNRTVEVNGVLLRRTDSGNMTTENA